MQTFTAPLALPTTVRDFFNTLTQHGEVTFHPAAISAKVAMRATTHHDLDIAVVGMEIGLAQLTGLRHPIAHPTTTSDGRIEAKVDLSDDVRGFFDTITGLAGIDFDPNSPETPATVTIEIEDDDDEYDLAMIVAEMNDTLHSLGIDANDIARPTLVA